MVEENKFRPAPKGQGIDIPPAPVPLSKKDTSDSHPVPVGEGKAPEPISQEPAHSAPALLRKKEPVPGRPMPPGMMDTPNPDMMFSGPAGMHKPEPHREHHPAFMNAPDVSISPPLFIKLDKYGDIVKNLHKLKSFSLAMRDALDAVSDIEKELTTGISLAHKALDEFNHSIANLDSKVLRVHGTDNAVDTKEIDDYIKNVYGQMERIKKELGSIKDV